jgi:Protein of unknown function (DUF1569)
MDPYLSRLHGELSSEIGNWKPDQINWHPPAKWSAAQILDLYLTYTGTVKGFGRILESGTPKASSPTWKNRLQATVVVNLGYLPSGREAPVHSRPKGVPAEKVVAEITPQIALMDEVFAQCAAKFGPLTRVLDHPFLGPLSVHQWRKFHLVHGRHHLKQLRRLRAELRANRSKEPS